MFTVESASMADTPPSSDPSVPVPDGPADNLGGFAKIYASILDSTICEETTDTRWAWITMLVRADKNGFVRSPRTPGWLARAANISVPAATKAIKVLTSPDPNSRSTAEGGRRLIPVDGGWIVVNHRRYREYRTPGQVETAARVRAWRQQSAEMRQAAEEVFNYWREQTKHLKAVLTESRMNHLLARLKEEPSDDVYGKKKGLMYAVDGAVKDPFFNGNETGRSYLDFENIFIHRGRDRIEKLQRLAAQPERAKSPTNSKAARIDNAVARDSTAAREASEAAARMFGGTSTIRKLPAKRDA